jgi:putative holliday junction resolvase
MAKTILAFDFGEKRIGVAVGNDLLRRAQPLVTIPSTPVAERFAAIERLVAQWQPEQLVAGIAYAADGSEHDMTRRCTRFANQLEGRFNVPVARVDERYSSLDADELARKLRRSGELRQGGPTDHLAAAVILERFFADNHASDIPA